MMLVDIKSMLSYEELTSPKKAGHATKESSWFERFSATNLPWGRRRSNIMGASALCYLIPLPFINTSGAFQLTFQFLFAFQCVLCFVSDFLYSGVPHWSHGVDKCHASALLVFIIAVGGIGIHPTYPLVAIAPLFCWQQGKTAVKMKDWDGYVLYHSLWHLIGGALLALTVFLMYNTASPLSDSTEDGLRLE